MEGISYVQAFKVRLDSGRVNLLGETYWLMLIVILGCLPMFMVMRCFFSNAQLNVVTEKVACVHSELCLAS